MAIGTGTALLLGGAAVAGGVGNYLASRGQVGAAKEAARQARATGIEAAGIVGDSEPGAADFLRQGADSGQGYLNDARGLLAGGSAQFGQRFQPEVDVGNQALGRLQSALLGGDISAIQMDPGYQFRREQGEQALRRAAAASGELGGGAFLKDTARFSQGLASQEYGNAVNRLLGLQQIGSQANRAQTGLQASLLGQQSGIYGQQSGLASNLGSSLASLRTSTAANQANALSGGQSLATQYQLAGAQAGAEGTSNLFGSLQQAGMLAALLAPSGGGGSGAYVPGISRGVG